MTRPTISVAMSVYNGARFLESAIESVLAQTFTDFEFLILDDGSSDGSLAIIERAAARDPRIRAITRENRGLVYSLNQMIAEARAGLIARMDADDLCLPERFERQLAFLEANPDYGVVGTFTRDIDADGLPFPLGGAEHPETHEEFLAAIAAHGPLLAHPSVMMRRDVLLEVGGYHAAFRHCEDFDLWLRLADRTRIANLTDRLLVYRHYAEQVSNRHSVEQQYGVAISRLAHDERAAGRPDPTEDLETLPPVGELDALFGREGVSRQVRATMARALLYSTAALTGPAFDILLQHVNEGGRGRSLWYTVPRLVRLGEPRRAARLAAALAGV